MRTRRITIALPLVLAVLAGGAAVAGPEEGVRTPIDVVAGHHQHGGEEGHLKRVRDDVKLVGKLDLFGDQEMPGRVSDVGVFGDYAYLGAFREPDCEAAGVYVVDISDPKEPTQAGFIPATPGAYVGEGVQVLKMDTDAFTGRVLLHNNENCVPGVGPSVIGAGGASLWDVTDPTQPKPLAQHVGDLDPVAGSLPHQSHSVFGWQQGERAYMVMVDNAELGESDIDIFEITDPASPAMVSETGMADFPQIAEDPPPNGAQYLNHDMIVERVDGRWLLLSSYWDGGYVILDVTDPAQPQFLRDTDFGNEPLADELGLPRTWIPEGNAHQAEFSHDDRFFLGADEDFDPFRSAGTILSGSYEGDVYSATLGSDVPDVPEAGIEGGTDFVGQACTPLPPAQSPIALIERGTCTFTVKAQNAQAAGYDMALVFNDQATDPDCESHVFMLAVADIPVLFVSRSTGLKLLDQQFDDPCAHATPVPFSASRQTRVAPVFDGWGYLHMFDAKTMRSLDEWALPQSLRERHATGSGDLSIHEVATDPDENLAYLSHYAGGFRVVRFSREEGIRQVGKFIDKGGNNFWGVEVLDRNGGSRPLVLASDRDAGLYIFRYTGP